LGRRSARRERPAPRTSRSGSSMRAARSSSEANTIARPSCSSSAGVAAARFEQRAFRRQRPVKRDQPALRFDRVVLGRTTAWSIRVAQRSGEALGESLPETSRVAKSRLPASARRPPRGRRRYGNPPYSLRQPALRLTKTGVSSDSRLNSSRSMRTPRRPAMAVRWMRALVEPEIARRNAQRILEGGARHDLLRRAIVATSCAASAPVSSAALRRSAWTAGIVAAVGDRHPQCLAQQRHRAGGAHDGACARREPPTAFEGRKSPRRRFRRFG